MWEPGKSAYAAPMPPADRATPGSLPVASPVGDQVAPAGPGRPQGQGEAGGRSEAEGRGEADGQGEADGHSALGSLGDDGLEVLLGRAVRALRHTWTVLPDDLDLAPHQGRALRIIDTTGPLRLSALAERLRIAPRSATEVADALQDRGLIERRPDPADRRAVLLSVTSAGARAASRVAAARQAGADAYFGRLTDADRSDLARILQSLLAAPPDPPRDGHLDAHGHHHGDSE